MVENGSKYVSEDEAKQFVAKYWSPKLLGTPKVVSIKATEPPMSLYPSLKVEAGCQKLHITQAISMVSIMIREKGF